MLARIWGIMQSYIDAKQSTTDSSLSIIPQPLRPFRLFVVLALLVLGLSVIFSTAPVPTLADPQLAPKNCPSTTPLFNPTPGAATATPLPCQTAVPTKAPPTLQSTTKAPYQSSPTLPGRGVTPFLS